MCRLRFLRRGRRRRRRSRNVNRLSGAGRSLARNWRRNSLGGSRGGKGRRRWTANIGTALREVLLIGCLAACGLQSVLVGSRGCYVRIIVTLILRGLCFLIDGPRRGSGGESNTIGPRLTALTGRRGRGWSSVRRRKSWGCARDRGRRTAISLAGNRSTWACRRCWPSIPRPGNWRRHGRETGRCRQRGRR